MFFTPELVECARRNAAGEMRDTQRQAVEATAPWQSLSDMALWSLMFGPTLPRAWLVCSGGGACLACGRPNAIYGWRSDPFNIPWKVCCPHCGAQFPTNDFGAFYQSGLDAGGVFDLAQADRALLFNTEHPDPADPLHRIGVDDGYGYDTGERSYRFIAYYLIRGPWKQGVLHGIRTLALAYLLTGERGYAHRALILLDRVADLYPQFDFSTQTLPPDECSGSAGYVSIWHDACIETQHMALAYDIVRDAVDGDDALIAFLAARAHAGGLPNHKDSAAAIRRNIEDGLLRHPLAHLAKIHCNFPATEVTQIIMMSILDEPGTREEVTRLLDVLIAGATTVDGLTGEKGLDGYASGTISELARGLALFTRGHPDLLPELLRRHPKLDRSWRFYIDTWVDETYYPHIGDGGSFTSRAPHYHGLVGFGADPNSLLPSPYPFFMALYQATGDPLYIQILYCMNGRQLDGLPHDIFSPDPEAFRRTVAEVIARHGARFRAGSVNLREWCLALLRADSGAPTRTAWLTYDSGGNHGHHNALNLGLYAYGLDLMPDFGYPAVQFSGHDGAKVGWYAQPAAHNTVVVDGQRQAAGYAAIRGRTTSWIETPALRLIRASAPEAGFNRYTFDGANHERICFYFSAPGAIHRVEIFAMGGDGDWQSVFRDDFTRESLGPDWQVVSGEWAIQDGILTGWGIVLCTRRFPGNQRVVYQASGGADAGTRGVNLAADDRAAGSCLFFAFQTGRTGRSALYLGSTTLIADAAPIAAPDALVEMDCIFHGIRYQQRMNGMLVQDYTQPANDVQFERTIGMMECAHGQGYLLDIFRVVGGTEHVKYQHSACAEMTLTGLTLTEFPPDVAGAPMRARQLDVHAAPGWIAYWRIDDEGMAPGDAVHLRLIDCTSGAEAGRLEQWVSTPCDTPFDVTWIPALQVQRRMATPPLSSAFVAVIEPYRGQPIIAGASRVTVTTPDGLPYPDAVVGIEVRLTDGARDLWLAADTENPLGRQPAFNTIGALCLPELCLKTDADICVLRLDAVGRPRSATLNGGRYLAIGETTYANPTPGEPCTLDLTI